MRWDKSELIALAPGTRIRDHQEVMVGGIFVLGSDGQLVEMREEPYESEDVLSASSLRFRSYSPATSPGR